MSGGDPTRLRVALVQHGGEQRTLRVLAAALRDRGILATVLSSPVPELGLRRRGFTEALAHVPITLAALLRDGYDVAHAFSPTAAAAALGWRRRTGGPVLFTCSEVLDRSRLADRRLRLRLLGGAVERCDALLAPSEEARVALERWLAVEATVVTATDGAAHARLYTALTARRRQR